MTPRGIRLLAVLAVAFAFAAVPLRSSSAAGARVSAVGWWSQRPGASELPEGGFEIALSPTGPLSQAALRIVVDAVQLNSALVELTESQAAGAEVAGITACPTTDKWAPANPGPWDEAPQPNCRRSEKLSRSLDGQWSADISSILQVGTNSVVLVPASHPDTQGAPFPYQLQFSRARVIASAPQAPRATTPAPSPSGAPPAPSAQPTTGFLPELTPAATAAPRSAVPSFTPVPDLPAAPTDDDGPNRPWWRMAILVPLAAMCGGAAVFGRRVARERGWLQA